jgi:hypothetical protein
MEWMVHEVRPRYNTADWMQGPKPAEHTIVELELSEAATTPVIPSTLIPYGSPYNPSAAVPMNNNASTNLAFFGTYGGATAGRINPNGAVIYTTNADIPQANVSRTLPLQAVFSGVSVDGANVPAASIAGAIEAYIRTNGPLRISAEICNVPEIAARRAAINPTRNDLVRQIVGTLTTQDNVFSV